MSTEFLLIVALVVVMTNLATVAVGIMYFRGRADGIMDKENDYGT